MSLVLGCEQVVLDHLPPPVENFRSRFQSRRHAVKHRRNPVLS
jgi:hypothetical protein